LSVQRGAAAPELPGLRASIEAILLVVDEPVTVMTLAQLLELYRERAVTFEQDEPLGELHVTWTGTDDGDVEVGDDYEGAPEKDPADKDEDGADEARKKDEDGDD
jgi:chromosome segregation and condensation protein ScpB